MSQILRQGIEAVKRGDKSEAFRLLSRAIQDNATAAQAWIWLSGVVDLDSERLFCLENALRVDPNHATARRSASVLRQQGILPAPPVPPASPVVLAAQEGSVSVQAKPLQEQAAVTGEVLPSMRESHSGHAAASPTYTNEALPAGEIKAVFQFVVQELARNTQPRVIQQELARRSIPRELIDRTIAEAQKALKGARAEKFRKRMVRGLLWTVAGTLVTCLTYLFASNLGGSYLLCYGAILFGVIDFLVGLVGWLSNR